MSHEVMKMTAHQFKEGHYDKAIIAVGSCECHGQHLAQGTDTLVAHMLSVRAADRLKGLLVLPPIAIGCSEHYDSFPFTLSLGFETMVAVIKDVLRTTYKNGIKRIFIMNGHDGNIAPAELASRQIKVEYPDIRIAYMPEWWIKAGELLPPDTFEVWNGLGHAGEGESSIAYYLYEDWCEPKLAVGVVPDKLPKDVNIQWLFGEITNTGATGDPTKASKAKGEKMVKVLVDCMVSSINALDACAWDYRSSQHTL